eukprot:9031620-Pyramimonas_sp.AAC.1
MRSCALEKRKRGGQQKITVSDFITDCGAEAKAPVQVRKTSMAPTPCRCASSLGRKKCKAPRARHANSGQRRCKT